MGIHDGRVAVITGAASGIGRAAAEQFVDGGGSAVGVDLAGSDQGWAEGMTNLVMVEGDVTDAATNEAAVAVAIEAFGGVDAAFFNAGKPAAGAIATSDMDDFDRTMDLNVRAVALGIRAVVPAMEKRTGGSIVITASTSGMGGDPNSWAYNTSKGAVINMARAAAFDLGPQGIRVNAVAPGPTETGMTKRLVADTERYESLRRRSALQRWAQAEEVAAVVNFLLSPAASIVTGALIPADGGISASAGHFLPGERRSPAG